jgi:nucleotide-binding universal stress UspA family protein
MSKPSSILVGLDFFESSIAALREAVRLHESFGGRLQVTHVIDGRIWDQMCNDLGISPEAVTDRAKARLRFEITEIAGPAENIDSTIVHGHPVEQLRKACHLHEADLVVLGANGLKENEESSLGNVASRILRHAPTDILIIRKDHTEPFRRILVGIDFSESSSTILTKAIDVAEANHADLTVVHVVPHLHQTPRYRGPLEALGFEEVRVEGVSEAKLMKQARQDLEAFVDEHRHLLEHSRLHSHVIADDNAADGLLTYCTSSEADLFVIGKHGHSNLEDIAVGSITEKIANEAGCSVFAVD